LSRDILVEELRRDRDAAIEEADYERQRAEIAAQRAETLRAETQRLRARVQELLDLRPSDLQLTKPFQVRLVGKGRKERICPLWPQTAAVLKTYCQHRALDRHDTKPLFANQRGGALTRFGVRY